MYGSMKLFQIATNWNRNIVTRPGAIIGSASAQKISFGADLAVTKTDGVTSASPGDTLTYNLTISNVGNQGATGVRVSDTLPANTTFVSASDGGAYNGGVVTWNLGSVPAGATELVRFRVTIDPAAADGLVIQNAAALSVPMFPAENRTLTSPPLTVFSRADLTGTTKAVSDLDGGDPEPVATPWGDALVSRGRLAGVHEQRCLVHAGPDVVTDDLDHSRQPECDTPAIGKEGVLGHGERQAAEDKRRNKIAER